MLPPYCIEISKLAEGQHTFRFEVRGDLFAEAPETEIQDASVHISVQLDRTRRHLDLLFTLTGQLTLACDRCLNSFAYPVSAEYRRIFSHDSAAREADDEVLSYLPKDAYRIDLRQDLFDFVALCVPLRKVPQGCPFPTCPSIGIPETHQVSEETEMARQLREKLGSPPNGSTDVQGLSE